MARRTPPDWARIRTVLLDMDGTLLDRHFDDHFWIDFVPRRYADARGMSLDDARRHLMERYRAEEGTLRWYDVDFWSDELGLDIPALKKNVEHLIAIHPNVQRFLKRAGRQGRKVYMVTNAHGKTLNLKMEKTLLAGSFDGIVVSHDLGFPKETLQFWESAQKRLDFDPGSTLLADDSLPVLEAAGDFGIRYLVHIARPSSTLPVKRSDIFFSIENFQEIMP